MNIRITTTYRWLLIFAIVFHFSFFSILGLSRHWGYMTSINDLGVFDQAVWGVLNVKFLLNTSQLSQPINWLGFHFHPILFLFVPLYAITPHTIWFIIAQAIALSIAAWPIFLLASRVCQSEKAGLIWSFIYLINPFLLNAAAWDFHPITIAVPFIASGMLAIEMSNFRLLFCSSLFILTCQEHLGIMVAGFGFLWWIKNKRWKTAIILILIGIVQFVLVMAYIIPAFSSTGKHPMLLEGLGQLSRYQWLGDSLNEILMTLLLHPIVVLKTTLIEFEGASYLLNLIIFFLGFPISAPVYLLPGLAVLVANMLSANPMPKDIFSYHSVGLIPILTVSAVFGAKRLAVLTKKLSLTELSGFVFIASCIGGYLLSPLPLPGAQNIWAPIHLVNLPDPTVQTIASVVGKKASISAQGNVGAHFSQRYEIYYYPNKVGDVDAVILRLESPTTNLKVPSGFSIKDRKYLAGMLDSHLQMDRKDYINSIEHLLSEKEYGVMLWEDPWLVFKRGIKDREPCEQVMQKLNLLRKEWEIE